MAVGLLVALVAGCGSSSKTSTSGTTAGSAATSGGATAPKGSPIKIGFVCTCTGPFASSTANVETPYKAWASSVNASGGINGHPVVVDYKDDAGNPGTSLSEVQSFVSSDHVIAVVDASNDDAAWASYVSQQNIPVVGTTTSTQPMFTNPDFYPEGQTEDSLFPALIGGAKKLGATNTGLIYCAEAVQCQQGVAPFKQTAAAENVPLVYNASISATAPNYTAQCLAAKQNGVKALFVGDAITVVEKVFSDCDAQGFDPISLQDGENLAPAFLNATTIKSNSIVEVPNLPYFATTPAVAAMNSALDKYFPGFRAKELAELPMESWVSGQMLEAAAKAGNVGANGSTPTAAQLTAGLNSFNGETLGGLAPPLTFAAGKPHTVDCWYLVTIKGGAFATPYGLAPTCVNS